MTFTIYENGQSYTVSTLVGDGLTRVIVEESSKQEEPLDCSDEA